MSKYLISLAVLVAACGGQSPSEIEYMYDSDGMLVEIIDHSAVLPESEGDFGDLEQAYSAPTTPLYQFGTRTASSHMQCDKTATGQVCSVPKLNNSSTKVATYFIDPTGLTTAQINEARDVIEDYDAQVSTLTLNEVTDQNSAQFILNKIACSGSGGTNIVNYACTNLTFDSSLTEAAGVVGNYQVHTFGVGHVDTTDIAANYSGINALLVFRHAVGYALGSWLGLGGRTDSGATNFNSSRTVDPLVSRGDLSTGEVCRLNNYNPSANGQFSNVGACGNN